MNNSNNNVRDYNDLPYTSRLNFNQLLQRHEQLMFSYDNQIQRLEVWKENELESKNNDIDGAISRYEQLVAAIDATVERYGNTSEAKKQARMQKAEANRQKNSKIRKIQREIALIERRFPEKLLGATKKLRQRIFDFEIWTSLNREVNLPSSIPTTGLIRKNLAPPTTT